MNIWTAERWKKIYNTDSGARKTGISLRFDKAVDPEVRCAVKAFVDWLRTKYFFPIRISIYIKSTYRIRVGDGELVVRTSYLPVDRTEEPYIRVAAGDYRELEPQWGRDDALANTLYAIAYELTHYFQWINNITLTEVGAKRQAKKYENDILKEYAALREHP